MAFPKATPEGVVVVVVSAGAGTSGTASGEVVVGETTRVGGVDGVDLRTGAGGAGAADRPLGATGCLVVVG